MGSTSPPHPTVPHSLAPPGSEMAWIRDCPIESPLTVQAREWWLEMADNLVALFHSKHGPKALPVRSSALSVPPPPARAGGRTPAPADAPAAGTTRAHRLRPHSPPTGAPSRWKPTR